MLILNHRTQEMNVLNNDLRSLSASEAPTETQRSGFLCPEPPFCSEAQHRGQVSFNFLLDQNDKNLYVLSLISRTFPK